MIFSPATKKKILCTLSLTQKERQQQKKPEPKKPWPKPRNKTRSRSRSRSQTLNQPTAAVLLSSWWSPAQLNPFTSPKEGESRHHVN
ncbi:GH14356 [Drosophila grimshawi]|uniref:GH14356 n=1 Tax=Drosophila grimshawi TaxID=7222 RepID=B4K409_DROGR|nr:GH14356 [Drosophila grimshawi]